MAVIKFNTYHYDSPVGGLLIKSDGICLREITFINRPEHQGIKNPDDKIIKRTLKQLDEYFAGSRKYFQLPLGLHYHTVFQRLIWLSLMEIPYGSTKTYKEIALSISRPRVYRAVGNACGQNCYAIVVPCHRAVSVRDGIGGFSADLNIKKKLLELESRHGVS